MPNLLERFLLSVTVISVFLSTPLTLYSAQDHIKENPELDRLLANSSPRDRDQLNKMLSSMPPEERQKFIQGMIDVGLKIEKDAITVERVFAKFHKGQDNQKGLTVSNGLRSTGEPLTETELADLVKLPLDGVLEIVQLGKGRIRAPKTQVRIVLIIQNPTPSSVVF